MSANSRVQLEQELVEANRQVEALREQVKSLQGIVLDNMQSAVRQLELSAALQRQTALFSDGPVVIFHLNASADPMIQYVSPNIAQFGYSAGEFISGERRYAHIIYADDRPQVRDTAYKHQEDPLISYYENTYRIQCADGSLRWVYDFTRIIRNALSRPTHFYFYIFDITERVKTIEQLQARQDLLDAFVEQSYDGVRLVDEKGRVLVWNQAMTQITGITSRQALGESIVDLLISLAPPDSKPEDVAVFRQRIQDVVSGTVNPRVSTSESEIWRPDGARRMVQSEVFPVNIGGQRLLASIVRDVSDLKQAEKAAQLAHQELQQAYDETLRGWARTLELRHLETQGHSERVNELTVLMAAELGITGNDLVHVRRGALLHDIGKMAIPDYILLKPGPLTESEWVIMRQHPEYAYEYLKEISFLKPALDIPRYHHERWDGNGYPFGLRGDEIPLAARIFSVVDVWDALGHERVYHPPWPRAEIEHYLQQNAGTQFDPRVVAAFLALIPSLQEGTRKEGMRQERRGR